MTKEIRWLGDLQKIEFMPGDKFVLSIERTISMEAREHIQRAWKQFVGGDETGMELLILDLGMKIGVLSEKGCRVKPNQESKIYKSGQVLGCMLAWATKGFFLYLGVYVAIWLVGWPL